MRHKIWRKDNYGFKIISMTTSAVIIKVHDLYKKIDDELIIKEF